MESVFAGFKADYKSIQMTSDEPDSTVEIPEHVTSSTVSDLTKRKYPDGGYGKVLSKVSDNIDLKLNFQAGRSSFVHFYCISLPMAYPTRLG